MADVTISISQAVDGGRWDGTFVYDPTLLNSSNTSTPYSGTITFTPDGTVGSSTIPISVTDGNIGFTDLTGTNTYFTQVGSASTPPPIITASAPGFALLNWQTPQPTSMTSLYQSTGTTFNLVDGSFTPPSGGVVTPNVPVTAICFYPGTLISTPRGDIRVEDLVVGDTVLTADGQERKIIWIGRQSITTYFADPKVHMPIEFAVGSLGNNLPRRPLRLSPGHSIWIDGLFPIASALVNHSTIRQLTKSEVPEHFTYYHLELEDHALVLAEGVPSETFVDAISRKHFHNWHEYVAMYGAEERSIAPLTENNARITRFEDLPEDLRKFIGPPMVCRFDNTLDLKQVS